MSSREIFSIRRVSSTLPERLSSALARRQNMCLVVRRPSSARNRRLSPLGLNQDSEFIRIANPQRRTELFFTADGDD